MEIIELIEAVIAIAVISIIAFFTFLSITIQNSRKKNQIEEDEIPENEELEDEKEIRQDDEIEEEISPEYKRTLRQFKTKLEELDGRDYILNRNRRDLIDNFNRLYFSLRDDDVFHKDPSIKAFLNSSSSFDILIEKNNNTYLENQIERNSALFNNIAGKSLDRNQRYAVVQEEINHLVIAGAGTGKTLTIAGKVKYLTEVKGITPEEILLISYSKKSVNDLQKIITEKMGIDVQAMTFHKLGKNIIQTFKKKKVDVVKETFAKETMGSFFREVLINNPIVINDFVHFYSLYINSPKDENLYSNLAEFYDNTRSYDFETLKSKLKLINIDENTDSRIEILKRDKITINQEMVKSIEEVVIANFLFLNGIEYEYETLYPFDEKDNYRKQYRPDFYLPEYDIWIEHFGINRDGSTPPTIDRQKYAETIEWKRNLHRKNNTTLLETYSWQNREGILLEKLEEMLRGKEVEFKPIDSTELYQKLFLTTSRKKDRHLRELQNLFITFLHLFKCTNKDISYFDELKNKTTREELFLNVFKEIYKHYQSKLEDDKRIDFDDMINQAAKIVNDNDIFFPYKYIVIDEYQDISFSRYNLVKAIKDKTDSKLMCVGDDWQSIYRFTGSDLSLFNSFEDYFGFTVTTDIVKTYRNSQELIDVAGDFIMKNREQIEKQLISQKHLLNPIQIYMYRDSYDGEKNYSYEDYRCQAILSAIDNIFGQEEEFCGEILLLGRTNNDLDDILGNFKTPEGKFSFTKDSYSEKGTYIKCSKYPNEKFKFLTVHTAKGLQAENVIVLNMKNDLLGFPNQIADDPILSLVLANKDSYDFAEERRLFYVAITRTENRTYLITPETNKSIFIKDLIEEKNVEIKKIGIDEHEDYGKCPICGGNLVVRLARHKPPFLGCEYYSRHKDQEYIVNFKEIPEKYICPICKEGYLIKIPSKFDSGYFIGCSKYPDCKYTERSKKKYRKR